MHYSRCSRALRDIQPRIYLPHRLYAPGGNTGRLVELLVQVFRLGPQTCSLQTANPNLPIHSPIVAVLEIPRISFTN